MAVVLVNPARTQVMSLAEVSTLGDEARNALTAQGWTFEDSSSVAPIHQGPPDETYGLYPAYPPPGNLVLSGSGAGPAVVGAVALVTFASVAARFGRVVAVSMWRVVRLVARRVESGWSIRWAQLPSGVKQLLVLMGVSEGADLLLDFGEADTGLFDIGGGGDLAIPSGGQIVRTWEANGTRFVRLSDGRVGAYNKMGVLKLWRPKKPIVIFAGGASTLKGFLRADSALNKQARRLQKALNRRAPRKQASRGPQVVVEHGQGSVVTR